MKKTLIAIMLSTSLIGGIGAALTSEKVEAAVLNNNNNNNFRYSILRNDVNDSDVLNLKSNCGVYQRRVVFTKYFGSLKGQTIQGNRPSCNGGNILGSGNGNGDNITDDTVSNESGLDNTTTGSGNNGDIATPPVVEGVPSIEDAPVIEETPSVEEKPTVDEIPSVEEKPVIEETPSVDNTVDSEITNDKFMAQVESLIYQKVNEERAKVGMSALSYNTTMEKYARIKSQDMGDNNYFSHEDLSGNLITNTMRNDGVTYSAWGENIAYIGGVSDANALAEQFMTNWMNSAGHRANILSNNFSSIGVGVYQVGNKVYATQEFYK